MRPLALGIVGIVVMACASAPEKRPPAESQGDPEVPIPQDLRREVERSSGIGRQLYVLDKVAAIGTDVLMENVPDPRSKGLAGYLPLQEADDDGRPKDAFLVTFFTAETPPRIAYEIRIAPSSKPTFHAFDPPKPATPSFALLVRARQMAIAALSQAAQPMNPVVLPGSVHGEKGTMVYLLAGTTKPNVAVFGKHFRALVPETGDAVSYLMPLSKSILEMPTRGPEGQEPAALVVTHLVTDYPLETHVFTSLLLKKAVYVGTRRGIWRVEGDRITLMQAEPPEGLR